PELAAYPAHLHIDLLPRWQGRGHGRRLLHTFRTGAASGDRVHAAGRAFALTSLTACAIAALAALLVFLLPKAPPTKG
ncbi:hypothetical protein ACWCQV_41735, partial [Streptomyces eurythermus]